MALFGACWRRRSVIHLHAAEPGLPHGLGGEAPPGCVQPAACQRCSEKGVRLTQKMQVGPCITVGVQLQRAGVGPTFGPTRRLSHSRGARSNSVLECQVMLCVLTDGLQCRPPHPQRRGEPGPWAGRGGVPDSVSGRVSQGGDTLSYRGDDTLSGRGARGTMSRGRGEEGGVCGPSVRVRPCNAHSSSGSAASTSPWGVARKRTLVSGEYRGRTRRAPYCVGYRV